MVRTTEKKAFYKTQNWNKTSFPFYKETSATQSKVPGPSLSYKPNSQHEPIPLGRTFLKYLVRNVLAWHREANAVLVTLHLFAANTLWDYISRPTHSTRAERRKAKSKETTSSNTRAWVHQFRTWLQVSLVTMIAITATQSLTLSLVAISEEMAWLPPSPLQCIAVPALVLIRRVTRPTYSETAPASNEPQDQQKRHQKKTGESKKQPTTQEMAQPKRPQVPTDDSNTQNLNKKCPLQQILKKNPFEIADSLGHHTSLQSRLCAPIKVRRLSPGSSANGTDSTSPEATPKTTQQYTDVVKVAPAITRTPKTSRETTREPIRRRKLPFRNSETETKSDTNAPKHSTKTRSETTATQQGNAPLPKQEDKKATPTPLSLHPKPERLTTPAPIQLSHGKRRSTRKFVPRNDIIFVGGPPGAVVNEKLSPVNIAPFAFNGMEHESISAACRYTAKEKYGGRMSKHDACSGTVMPVSMVGTGCTLMARAQYAKRRPTILFLAYAAYFRAYPAALESLQSTDHSTPIAYLTRNHLFGIGFSQISQKSRNTNIWKNNMVGKTLMQIRTLNFAQDNGKVAESTMNYYPLVNREDYMHTPHTKNPTPARKETTTSEEKQNVPQKDGPATAASPPPASIVEITDGNRLPPPRHADQQDPKHWATQLKTKPSLDRSPHDDNDPSSCSDNTVPEKDEPHFASPPRYKPEPPQDVATENITPFVTSTRPLPAQLKQDAEEYTTRLQTVSSGQSSHNTRERTPNAFTWSMLRFLGSAGSHASVSFIGQY